MSEVTESEVALLEQRLNEIVVFFDTKIEDSVQRWRHILVGKFLGHGFFIEFVDREMRLRWNVSANFSVSASFEGFSFFCLFI